MKKLVRIKLNESGVVCVCELDCDMGFNWYYIMDYEEGSKEGFIYVLENELEEMKSDFKDWDIEYEIVSYI